MRIRTASWPLGNIGPVQTAVFTECGGSQKVVPGVSGTMWPNWHGVRPKRSESRGEIDCQNFKDTRCGYAGTVEELYVDQSATHGNNTGLDWQNAFLELRDALEYARTSICGTVHSIYVAQGTYSPGDKASNSFVLPDGISVYGGFPKGGGELWQRNPGRYQAVLTGTVSGSP